ncbi:MAG: type IV pili methyl-accepting chemotaxis transducer N-terminal domain-containing protein [Bacteroidota bacterium]
MVISFFRRNLTAKILLCAGTMFVLAVATVIGISLMVEQQRTDAVAINEAGKLRMLSQRIAKTTYMVGIGTSEAIGEMSQAKDQYAVILHHLLHGAPDRNLDPTVGEAREQLERVAAMWETYQGHAVAVIEANDDARITLALQEIQALNVPLLQEANKAVSLLEAQARAKTDRILNILLISLLLYVGLFAGVAYTVHKAVKPLRGMTEVAKQVAEGRQVAFELEVPRTDEVGEMAESFKAMSESIRNLMNWTTASSAESQELADEAQRLQEQAEQDRKALETQVQDLLERIDQLAEGDLSVAFDTNGGDLMGQLHHGLAQATRRMRKTLVQIQGAVQEAAIFIRQSQTTVCHKRQQRSH